MDYIGILISIVAFVYLVYRNMRNIFNLSDHPTEKELEEHPPTTDLDKFLKSLEAEKEESERKEKIAKIENKIPPKPSLATPGIHTHKSQQNSLASLDEHHLKSKIQTRRLEPTIAERKLKSDIEKRSIDIDIRKDIFGKFEDTTIITPPSRAEILLKSLPHLKNVIIYDAILNRPKGW